MIKQNLTTQRTEEVDQSLFKLAILSELFLFEHKMVLMDTAFKTPVANNFAKRIGMDAKELKSRLGSVIVVKQDEYAEEFIGVLWNILDTLCKLDLEPLQEFSEYVSQELEKVGV
jgi:hypothetical protein